MDVSPPSSRKRGHFFHEEEEEEEEEEWLTLTLSLPPSPPPSLSSAPPSLPPPVSAPSLPFQFVPLAEPMSAFSSSPPQETNFLGPPPCPFPLYEPPELELLPRCEFSSQEAFSSSSRQGRPRRLPVRAMKKEKSDSITPPFPWATSKRATVYSLEHLLTHGMRTISGTVQCKQCEQQHDIEFDLQQKFYQVAQFIAENKYDMHDRAPSAWTNPVLPKCERCGQENSLKPVITKKRTINWLFLILGQMLGCCKLEHLKYFCKHTKNHRTGAKDRLLYLTYMGLCKQLHPEGPYDVNITDYCS